MLFQSWIFLLFFAVFYPVYLAVKNTPLRLPWLLAGSYVFYGWLNPFYLLLILYATTVDYLAALAMARWRPKRLWLILSIGNDLALLGTFKYAGFLAENLNWLLSAAHVPYHVPAPGLLLPIGLSFFLFQSMTYTIDFYRGQVPLERNFLRYAAFVSLFTQLLSGPIERARNLLPQLRGPVRITWQDAADAASLFTVGFFKKVALADALALYVNKVYGAPQEYPSTALWLATFAYAWQIYFDFSGYTDMARGVARLLGIRVMLNFNNPYLATGIGDFWRRWHISLSSWFRDYVYIPLGGSRNGELATYRNVFLTMLVSGLWHGAMWTFVIWGAWHGLGAVLTRRLERAAFWQERVPKLLKQALTFAWVTFAWIFFRADSVPQALTIIRRSFDFQWRDPGAPVLLVGLVLAVWLYQFLYESPGRRVIEWAPVRFGLVVAMIVYCAVFMAAGEKGFIYLQF